MLIDKGVSVGDVITIKLISGEEIIARNVEETDQYFKVSKPLILIPTEDGRAQWIPYVQTISLDKDLKIAKSSIVLTGVTVKQVADGYIQSTTSIKLA